MKGPSDISGILSGLKTKTISISEKPPVFDDDDATSVNMQDSSTISIDDIKSIQTEMNIPKRTKRRPKSDKNIVSLDI